MTPERQKKLRAYLFDMSGTFNKRIRADSVDALDSRMCWLEYILGQNMTLTELFETIEQRDGPESREGAEHFMAACAAMTLATYLTEVDLK